MTCKYCIHARRIVNEEKRHELVGCNAEGWDRGWKDYMHYTGDILQEGYVRHCYPDSETYRGIISLCIIVEADQTCSMFVPRDGWDDE